MAMRCSICGGGVFASRRILWPELISAWELGQDEVEYIDRQQGTHCTKFSASLRIIALGRAIQDYLNTHVPLADCAASRIRILDLNGCEGLSSTPRRRFRGYVRGDFPEVDMTALPYGEGSFDLVMHSDTLEHVPDAMRGLAECRRVLNAGGRLCYTVPIIVGRPTRIRGGTSPSYHGNPSTSQHDFLVHTEFGSDAWTLPLRAGFDHIAVVSVDYPAAHALAACNSPRPSRAAPTFAGWRRRLLH